jgi:hypothetical protein
MDIPVAWAPRPWPIRATKRATHKNKKIPKNKIFFRVIRSKTRISIFALRLLVTKRATPPV